MNEIKVSAERDYVVSFPNSWRSRFNELVANRRFAVIVPEQISSQIKDVIDPSHLILTSDGESQKSIDTYGSILEKLALMGLDRSSLIVGIGGGATTDLAGFVAATYLRGVDWVAIPTTVAGMVDAAIGGKTGVNLTSGKNLVGAFYSPHEVVIDTNWLSTLSDRDIRAGLAEAVKCGFISEPKILEFVTDWKRNLTEIIALSVGVKAGVVSRDFKESHEREILNYGHTLGHAIEKHSGYSLRHGEAVSIGMCFAADLSVKLSGLSGSIAEQHREILQSLELPVTYSATAFDALFDLMQSDKKRGADGLRFVTLKALSATDRATASKELLNECYLKSVGR